MKTNEIHFRNETTYLDMIKTNFYYKFIKILLSFIILVTIFFTILIVLLLFVYHLINIDIILLYLIFSIMILSTIMIFYLYLLFTISGGVIPIHDIEYTKIILKNNTLLVKLFWPSTFWYITTDENYIYNAIPVKYIKNVTLLDDSKKKEHSFSKKIFYKRFYKNNCINYLLGINIDRVIQLELKKPLPLYNYKFYQIITGFNIYELEKENVKKVYISLNKNDIQRFMKIIDGVTNETAKKKIQ